jgi:hypothetical protein
MSVHESLDKVEGSRHLPVQSNQIVESDVFVLVLSDSNHDSRFVNHNVEHVVEVMVDRDLGVVGEWIKEWEQSGEFVNGFERT